MTSTKRRDYRGITHPAVAAIACPYCRALKGVPCRRREQNGQGAYTQTHVARVRAAAKLQVPAWQQVLVECMYLARPVQNARLPLAFRLHMDYVKLDEDYYAFRSVVTDGRGRQRANDWRMGWGNSLKAYARNMVELAEKNRKGRKK